MKITVLSALLAFAGAAALPAQAQTWMTVHKGLQIETESMAIDADGYVLFKTREIKDDGAIAYQHKEAVHCGRKTHYFRNMYDASAEVNSPNSDDAWTDWRDNPRELYEQDRLAAIRDFACSRNVGEVGVPVCDELIRKQRLCWQSVSDAGIRTELQQIATKQAATLRAMSPSFAETVCKADLDLHRKKRDYGCDW
jgi:hypothetical protein